MIQTLIDFISVSQKWKFLKNETFTKKTCCSKGDYFKSDCWKKMNFFADFKFHRKLFVFRRRFEGTTLIGWLEIRKQASICALVKRCSGNIQQICWRTLISKCDFSKVAKQLYWNHAPESVFSCKFAALFLENYSLENLWRSLSGNRIEVSWMDINCTSSCFLELIIAI